MILTILGIINQDGSVSLPEVDLPTEYIECLCHEGVYYFFFTQEEKDQFYQEKGLNNV
jgi:hypothetical protein